jgi:hypothetical protein
VPVPRRPARLCRRWVHSHEEDTATELVFRPEEFDFPPSRGRSSLELRPDGTAIEQQPGPVDRARRIAGVWQLKGDVVQLRDAPRGRPRRELRIASAEANRLVVRKPAD